MHPKMTQAALAELARRLPADADKTPRLITIKAQLGRAQVIVADLIQRKAALESDTALSPAGRRDQFRSHVAKTVAADLARLSKIADLTGLKLDASQARNEAFPAPDKADAAAASRRVEYRSLLRSMKNEGERIDAALGNPEVAAAILESADFASGIHPQSRKALVKAMVARDPVRSAQAAEIDVARDALVILRETAGLARGAASELGEFEPREIAPFIAASTDAAEVERSATRAVDAMSL
jgi:hypothetical protein